MTSTGGSDDAEPIDPDFAGLFRPEDIAPAAPMPPPPAPPLPPAPEVPETPAAAEAPVEPVAPVAEPSVDTGRLFRSQGVIGRDDAVLALASDHFGRLRTLERRRDGESAAEPDAAVLADAGPLADGSAAGIAPALDAEGADAHVPRTPAADAVTSRPSRGRSARAITGGAVYLIVIGVTVLVAFANALLSDGDLGWPTGLALLVSSVYAALTVRREDDAVAMIVPPIAFLVAALTAGQIFLDSAGGSVVNRAVVVFFSLADNWVWIIGATVAALVIVLVRRRRA